MAVTRSNRRGDWTQMMAIKPPAHSAAFKTTCEEKLLKLAALPTIKNSKTVTAALGDKNTPPFDPKNSANLLDTSMYPPTETPPGFGLTLLPHQKRGLTWMLSVEDPARPVLVQKGTKSNFRVFGGIVADKPGTGKSVQMIALVKSNPCRAFFECAGHRIRTGATLLLCPRNILDQWVKEIRRCDPTLSIVQIPTLNILYSVSCADIVAADVVILPYFVLADPTYMANAIHIDTLNPQLPATYSELARFRGVLSRFHFHRIVYDEVHEIYDQTKKQEFPFVPFMENFTSNWRWGLTGTPPKDPKLFTDVLNCIARADLKFSSRSAIGQLKFRIVRSNNPDLGIPGTTQEIKWIDLSAQEIAMYNLFRNSSTNAQLMACSHFNVNDIPINGLELTDGMTIDEVSEKLQEEHAKKVEEMENDTLPDAERRIPRLQDKVENLEARLLGVTDAEKRDDLRRKLANAKFQLKGHERTVARCLKDIPRLKTEIKYFANILEALKTGEDKCCPICLEDFEEDGTETIGLTPCGHAYCLDCLKSLGNGVCSLCRAPILQSAVMTIKLNSDKENNILCETFGAKINQLVLYIAAQLSIDKSFKFIIFVQYSKLSKLVSSALVQHDLLCVNLIGTVAARGKALAQFQNENVSVLLMSAEQSVSGANIIAASHVIIFHPFNLATEEESIAAEEQGIARACRLGQTRSVQVVRFVTRGTIEEKMTKARIGRGAI